MILKRLRSEAAHQNWFGVTVDFLILVLGVFLGIQVNNWNQARLERAEGREYRERLISDLESNQRDLAFRIHYDGQALAHARDAMAALDSPANRNPGEFIIHAYEASNHIPQPLRHFTYDEAVAAGKAERLGDPALLSRARTTALQLARTALAEGVDPVYGGVFAERDEEGRLDDEKHWWMQAEAVVGFLNAYELTAEETYFAAAERTWAFVENFLIDRIHGEWRWRVRRDGTPIPGLPKIEPWKCPYHNSRAAFEVADRVQGQVLTRCGPFTA